MLLSKVLQNQEEELCYKWSNQLSLLTNEFFQHQSSQVCNSFHQPLTLRRVTILTGQTAVANSRNVLGQTAISNHIHTELHLIAAQRGPTACTPQPPQGSHSPGTCHQQVSLHRTGPSSRSASCQLQHGRHLSCLKASHSSLWKGEGRFKDTPACLVYRREKATKSHLKTTG